MIRKQLADLASALLGLADHKRLHAMTGAVPVVAIIGDVRDPSPAADRIYHAVVALPGSYLGTAPVGAARH
jgi:hypothetical protein